MNSLKPTDFKVFDHSGDLRIEASGADFLEALAHASSGLMAQLVELHNIREVESREVHVKGDDRESQAIALLNELLFLADGPGWLCRRVQVMTVCSRKGCSELTATLAGEPRDPARHRFQTEIKAVTYHGFRIVDRPGNTTIEFVCDL